MIFLKWPEAPTQLLELMERMQREVAAATGIEDAQMGQMRDCMLHGKGVMMGGKHMPLDQFYAPKPDEDASPCVNP